jgi:hypothetical protein
MSKYAGNAGLPTATNARRAVISMERKDRIGEEMTINIHYSRQIAVGFSWHLAGTFFRLHVTVMLPWICIEIGLFKKGGAG